MNAFLFFFFILALFFLSSPKDVFIDFRERGRMGGREREREKGTSM